MSFEKLKKSRTSNISKLVEAAEKISGSGEKNYADDRMWKPTVDKAGNGHAVIRFLPAPDGEDLPWVRYWDHGFQGPTGRWYIEKSLTTLGQQDPVSEANTVLWNSGREEDKQIARDRKRRLHYVSNIMVISDPSNPENNGKVFLFLYGKKIFDKLMDVMQPEFDDETPMDPFDFWGGADFKLKIRKVDGYRNYDKSEFADSSELEDGDEAKLKKIYESLHSLAEFVDPSTFKPYDELKKRLDMVLGASGPMTTIQRESLDETESAPSMTESSPVSRDDDASEDDEALSYFAKLAAQTK